MTEILITTTYNFEDCGLALSVISVGEHQEIRISIDDINFKIATIDESGFKTVPLLFKGLERKVYTAKVRIKRLDDSVDEIICKCQSDYGTAPEQIIQNYSRFYPTGVHEGMTVTLCSDT